MFLLKFCPNYMNNFLIRLSSLFISLIMLGFLLALPVKAEYPYTQYTTGIREITISGSRHNPFIQHSFRIERNGEALQDAIVLPKTEYETLSVADLEAMMEERYSNWLTYIHPSPPTDPVSVPEFGLLGGLFAIVGSGLSYLGIKKSILSHPTKIAETK